MTHVAAKPRRFLASSYIGWPVSLVSLVVISLATKHHPNEDVDAFFDQPEIRTGHKA